MRNVPLNVILYDDENNEASETFVVKCFVSQYLFCFVTLISSVDFDHTQFLIDFTRVQCKHISSAILLNSVVFLVIL